KLTHMPLILEGAIKIVNEDEDSNEFLLYYLETGDSCAMTMTCCLGNKKSEIRAVTEKPTLLYMIPIQKMEEWLIKYKTWRAFVFESYDLRMSEMLEAINVVVFHNMEGRLYKYLKDRAMVFGSPYLDITHYKIANDLNTSRVVISRLVKKLALDNKIITNRNQITVIEFLPKNERTDATTP
ncbi:MAG: Crp/Fnr family transcriptional regulator, partial [Saprospiraceae bacterium]